MQEITLGQIATFEMGQSPDSHYVSDSVGGIPFLQGNAEFGTIHPLPHLWCRQPKKVCQPGDCLISVRAPVGAINRADQGYCIGRGLAAVRFEGAHPRYGAHLLAHFAPNLLRRAQGTTFEAIGKDDLSTLRVSHFSDFEQAHIAEVLDTLDEAIHRTESVILKLRASSEGLRRDLLTRGISSNGDLRLGRSEAPHLYRPTPMGWIPKEWNLSTIGGQFDIQLGKMLDAEKSSGELCLYIGNKAVQWERIDIREAQLVALRKEERIRFRLKAGDLLVCEGGEVGRAAIWDEPIPECYYQKALHRLRPKSSYQARLLLEFLRYWTSHDLLSEYISKTSIAHLTQEKLSAIPLPFPSEAEQRSILKVFEDNKTRLELEEEQLAKLSVLKSGLTSDLLTGRVRTSPH